MTEAARPVISAETARRLLLSRQGLSDPPNRRLDRVALAALIERIGFVQVDSIATVERAHHHILWSRATGYQRKDLARLLERDRALFENWTHDASIVPTAFFPHWRLRFERERARLLARWRQWRREGFDSVLGSVLERVAREGPLRARDFEDPSGRKSGGWWDWKPTKTALEYHWRTGALAVAARDGFEKLYDLTERVLPPAAHGGDAPAAQETIDWACGAALDRLGTATTGEIAAFWANVRPEEAKAWAATRLGGALVEVDIAPLGEGRPRRSLVRPETLETLGDLPEPPRRLRALNPFDPVIRDRNRLARLFDFDYRIEVFTPAEKRRYGYYVFPLLEGDRFTGRLDARADRSAGLLIVQGLWWEPGVKPTKGRQRALEAELDRMRRFAGVDRVTVENGVSAP